jgi:hypothetical protein
MRDEGFVLVAVRTALHPELGTIDTKIRKKLVKE